MNPKTNYQRLLNFTQQVLSNIREMQKETKTKEFDWNRGYDFSMRQLYMINLGFSELFQSQELSNDRQMYSVIKSMFGCLMLLLHTVFRQFFELNSAKQINRSTISFIKQQEKPQLGTNRMTKFSVSKLILSQRQRYTQVENELNYFNTKEKESIDYNVEEKMMSPPPQEEMSEQEINEQVIGVMEEIEKGNYEIIEHVTEPLVLLKINEKISNEILTSQNLGY